jgi:hypothetical protein
MTEVAEQVLLNQPERRTEVIDWYKSIFEEWIEGEGDDAIIDTELIAFFVTDAVNANMTELIPQMTELFEHGLVAEGVSGNLESCLKYINKPSIYSEKKDIFNSISERYNYFISTWLNYTDGDDSESYNDMESDDDEVNEYINQEMRKLVPLPGEKPNVGRNDPCPCGSGKKYKKCCLGK